MPCVIALSSPSPTNPLAHAQYSYTIPDLTLPPQPPSPLLASNSSNWMAVLNFQPSAKTTTVPAPRPDGSLLKRKRPAMRIEIPEGPSLMSCCGSLEEMSGKREMRVNEIEAKGEIYAVHSKRGRKRSEIEDRFSASAEVIDGDSKLAFFGVFDGHGGAKAAEFATSQLGKSILDRIVGKTNGKYNDIETVVREGYLATDSDYLNSGSTGGSCCVSALIQNNNLVVSNAGDCRAVLSRDGVAEALTVDHKPSREDERIRIESSGGYVDCCNGVWRIQGSLAVSRSLGDGHLKQWVTAEPETVSLRIEPDCQFLILASDGVWDKVTNQEAVDTVLPFCWAGNGDSYDKTNKQHDLPGACRELVELAVKKGSQDDATAMVILLHH